MLSHAWMYELMCRWTRSRYRIFLAYRMHGVMNSLWSDERSSDHLFLGLSHAWMSMNSLVVELKHSLLYRLFRWGPLRISRHDVMNSLCQWTRSKSIIHIPSCDLSPAWHFCHELTCASGRRSRYRLFRDLSCMDVINTGQDERSRYRLFLCLSHAWMS